MRDTDLGWTRSTTSTRDGAPYFIAYIHRNTSKPTIGSIRQTHALNQ